MELELEDILTILDAPDPPTQKKSKPIDSLYGPYPPPKQHGPIRHYDREMRCADRGCGSSTFLKLLGIPRCVTHCLKKMNEMLYEMGVDSSGN